MLRTGLRIYVLPQLFALSKPHWSPGLYREVSLNVTTFPRFEVLQRPLTFIMAPVEFVVIRRKIHASKLHDPASGTHLVQPPHCCFRWADKIDSHLDD